MRLELAELDAIAEAVADKLRPALESMLDKLEVGRGDELLDVRDAARLLGCSAEALYRRIPRGTLPGVVRAGRSVRIKKVALVGGSPTKEPRR